MPDHELVDVDLSARLVLRVGRGRLEGLGDDPRCLLRHQLEGAQRILDDLKLPAEEAEILKPKIESILKAQSDNQRKLYELSNEMRKLMGSETDSAALKAKLDAYRAKRTELEAALKKLQEELRELLTYEQEAKLVLHRVLE